SARMKLDMVWPDGKAAIAVASLEDVTVAELRRIAPPIEAASTLHSFVMLSAGFHQVLPLYVGVSSGSLQMQLAPNAMHCRSSALALVAQRSDSAAKAMNWVRRWVAIIGNERCGMAPFPIYGIALLPSFE